MLLRLLNLYKYLDGQTIRICGLFFSESEMANYIVFQFVSLDISLDRLDVLYAINPEQTSDASLMKNARCVCDNLLLTLRLKERLDDSLLIIRKLYDFLDKHGLQRVEMEWLITNWCKVKRDAWKAKISTYQALTIVDYLRIGGGELALAYLLEEVRTYNYFKAVDSSIVMHDEVYLTLVKLVNIMDASSDDSLHKCRIQLEIAQFCWLNYEPPASIVTHSDLLKQ